MPVFGSNQPPPDQTDPELLTARLERDYAALAARFTELELGAAKVPAKIDSEASASRVLDWIAEQCKRTIAQAERDHAREKKPYLEGGRAIDRFFFDRIRKLNAVLAPISRRVQQFYDVKKAEIRRREEAERRAATAARAKAEEEAARLAAAARAREAAGDRQAAVALTQQAEEQATQAAVSAALEAAPPAPVAIRGEYGASAFGVERWDYEIVDPAAVPLGYQCVDDAAVRAAMKDGVRDIPGLRIFLVDNFRIRRC